MNPNDPFGRGNNRDTMNDLLTTPTRDRLLFPMNLVTKVTLEKTGQR